ncbi:MAG: UPF0280 family protein [Candidatus Bathyarchaeota archaeon]
MRTGIFTERKRFKESSILFKSDNRGAIAAAISSIRVHRIELETYNYLHPDFQYLLNPTTIELEAPRIVKLMAESTIPFDMGPMAAVAGVIADLAVEAMQKCGAKIAIVEDGGEISANSHEPFVIALHAGKNALSNKIGFRVYPEECPIGIATSSSTIGHAISFGEADSVTIFAKSAGVADGAATAVCNSVRGKDVKASVQNGLAYANQLNDIIRGAMIIREGYVGSIGKIPQLLRVKKGLDINKVLHLEFPDQEKDKN